MKTKRWKSGSDTPQRNKTELWGKIPVFPIWLTKQKTGPVARKKANDVIPLEFFLCKESGCQEIFIELLQDRACVWNGSIHAHICAGHGCACIHVPEAEGSARADDPSEEQRSSISVTVPSHLRLRVRRPGCGLGLVSNKFPRNATAARPGTAPRARAHP